MPSAAIPTAPCLSAPEHLLPIAKPHRTSRRAHAPSWTVLHHDGRNHLGLLPIAEPQRRFRRAFAFESSRSTTRSGMARRFTTSARYSTCCRSVPADPGGSRCTSRCGSRPLLTPPGGFCVCNVCLQAAIRRQVITHMYKEMIDSVRSTILFNTAFALCFHCLRVTETLPLLRVSTAFAAKTLPLPCASTAFV